MKRLLIFTFLIFHVIIASAQENRIDGKWTGIDEKGDSAVITFKFNTTIMEFGGEVASTFDYKIDYTKDPIWMELIFKNENQKEVINALVRFIDADKIKWELFPYATSIPIKFTSESNETNETTMILTRVK
jgi:hypothetical protein